MSDEKEVFDDTRVPQRDQDSPLKERLHESPVPDNRLSGEQMPLEEATIGYGAGGPDQTVVGEDDVTYHPAPSAPQFGPAIGGDTGPDEDTHEIGSYAEGGSHKPGNRQTEKREKQGGRTMTGYPDYYRPEEEREE